MKRKKLPAAALVLTIGGETLLSARHSDAVAPPQPHIELEIATPPATSVSVISASGEASAAPFALDADDLGALPFRTTYDSYTNLSVVLKIFQDDAIVVPHEEGNVGSAEATMPEEQRCIYCDKTIDQEKEKFTTVDSTPEKFGDPVVPRLAHSDCHNAVAGTLLPTGK